MKFFQKKKNTESLAQIVARFKVSKNIGKLSKKDLAIVIDEYKFHFIDIPLNKKGVR